MSEQTPVVPRKYLPIFVLLVSCFALWGLLNNMTDNLVPAFQKIFMTSQSVAGYVQISFYGAYSAIAIFASLLIQRAGYRVGVLAGLAAMALCSLLQLFDWLFLGRVAGVAAGAPMCGIKAKKALDLFAAPACVFLCLARLAEGGMDTIGTGSEVEASWLQWFPLTMTDSWGESWYLCVFFLEALWALICLVPALRVKQAGDRDGDVFARTAVWMLGAQIGFEMYLKYPFDR